MAPPHECTREASARLKSVFGRRVSPCHVHRCLASSTTTKKPKQQQQHPASAATSRMQQPHVRAILGELQGGVGMVGACWRAIEHFVHVLGGVRAKEGAPATRSGAIGALSRCIRAVQDGSGPITRMHVTPSKHSATLSVPAASASFRASVRSVPVRSTCRGALSVCSCAEQQLIRAAARAMASRSAVVGARWPCSARRR